jgi:hypothetical protein
MKTEYALEWYSNEDSTWNEQHRCDTMKEIRAEAKRYYDIWNTWKIKKGRKWRVVKITRKVVGYV